MPVFDDLRCAFVHIPKTGGTSLTEALRAKNGPDVRLHGEVAGEDFAKLTLPKRNYQHIGWFDFEQFVGAEVVGSYFAFTVVRNPWDRMISHYFWARHLGDRLRSDPATAHEAEAPWLVKARDNDFGTWLDLSNAPDSQLGWLQHAQRNVRELDFVARTSSLAQDWELICERLGVEPSPLQRLLETGHATRYELYDDRRRRLISDWCSDDIEAFGFTFDD